MDLEAFIPFYERLVGRVVRALAQWDALLDSEQDRVLEALHLAFAERYRQFERGAPYAVRSALDPIDQQLLAYRDRIEGDLMIELPRDLSLRPRSVSIAGARSLTPPEFQLPAAA